MVNSVSDEPSNEGNIRMLEKGISVLRSMVGRGQHGVTFKFDKAKYPDDLAEVPDDAYERSRTVCLVQHQGFAFGSDLIVFEFSGQFRAFEQVIEGDDA